MLDTKKFSFWESIVVVVSYLVHIWHFHCTKADKIFNEKLRFLCSVYYKMQLILLQMKQLFYYEIRQNFIIKCQVFTEKCESFIAKCIISKSDDIISKYDSYYKMWRLLLNASVHALTRFFCVIEIFWLKKPAVLQ